MASVDAKLAQITAALFGKTDCNPATLSALAHQTAFMLGAAYRSLSPNIPKLDRTVINSLMKELHAGYAAAGPVELDADGFAKAKRRYLTETEREQARNDPRAADEVARDFGCGVDAVWRARKGGGTKPKFNDATVARIKADDRPIGDVASDYNVSRTIISAVRNGHYKADND